MNYQEHYDRLIQRGKTRTLECYTEKHHIVPRCLGGSDDKENFARLTPEEHYLAHQLLVKMNPGHLGLARSAIFFKGSNPNNKVYGWLRKRVVEAQRGKPLSAKTREKIAAAHRGKTQTAQMKPWEELDEYQQRKLFKQGSSRVPTGWVPRTTHKNAGKTATPETKQRMSEAHKGVPKTATHKAALSASLERYSKCPQLLPLSAA
jgi:hypothetical protein